MSHDISDLQIHIHKVDGATTIFVQNDADEAKRILDGFEPARIFDRDIFVATDGNSITSLPTAKITRIDLISEQLPHLVFPVGIVDAVELTEAEFQALIRNPVMREQWKQTTAHDDCLVTFMDLEMADGQCLFLTTEMHVERQSEELWKRNWFPLGGAGLCFRMRTGGVAVLNLANLIRLTFFPKPAHPLADAWNVHEFHARQPARKLAGGNFRAPGVDHPLSASFFPPDHQTYPPLKTR